MTYWEEQAMAMLETWGLFTVGGRFRSALPRLERGGGRAGADADSAACRYVESTAGFHRARPVLRWMHVEGRDSFEHFWIQLPGEPLHQSLRRLGWTDCGGMSPRQICSREYLAFIRTLALRLREDPFLGVSDPVEDSGEGMHPIEAEQRRLLDLAAAAAERDDREKFEECGRALRLLRRSILTEHPDDRARAIVEASRIRAYAPAPCDRRRVRGYERRTRSDKGRRCPKAGSR